MDTESDEKAEERPNLAEENSRLRRALEFYARATTNDFNFERGDLARRTLNGKCPTTPQTNSTRAN